MSRKVSAVSSLEEPMFQRHENDEALMCIVHEPGLPNLWGNLHPVGRLYERPFDLEKAISEHRTFVETMQNKGVEVVRVADVLAQGCCKGHDFDMSARIRLEELAMKNLKYELSTKCDPSSLNDEERFYLSDQYKRACIEKINTNQLIEVVMTCPTVTLDRSHRDTALVATDQSMAPVGNLIFTRDQQITTAKGIVFGNMASQQREGEVEIMREVFSKLGIPIIGHVEEPGTLEGGDFIPAGDTCFIGTGLRTNTVAVRQLMDNDLLGYKYVAEVQDVFERSQDRMHLDCCFNVIGEKTVMLMDALMHPNSLTRRLVSEYARQSDGKYRLRQGNVELSKYLRSRGYDIISIPEEYQLQYGVNCLNLGNSQLIMMHEPSARLVARSPYFKGTISVIDYSDVTSMYGSLHCTSQIVRRRCCPVRESEIIEGSTEASVSPVRSPGKQSCSAIFICGDIAFLHRDGFEGKIRGDAETIEKCSQAKGRELQQMVHREISALHLILSTVQDEVLPLLREEHHFEEDSESRPRPCALFTSHIAIGRVAIYEQCKGLPEQSVRIAMDSRVYDFVNCPIRGLRGALDLVIDYSSQVAFVSNAFQDQKDELMQWGELLGLSCLVMLDVHPDYRGHLCDILFVSSSLVIVCGEHFLDGSVELLKNAFPAPRAVMLIEPEQAENYCTNIVEVILKTKQRALVLSKSVLSRFNEDQERLLRSSSERLIESQLSVCEAIGLGSTRDFVVPLV